MDDVRNVKMCVMDGFGKETWRVGICVLKGVSKLNFKQADSFKKG